VANVFILLEVTNNFHYNTQTETTCFQSKIRKFSFIIYTLRLTRLETDKHEMNLFLY